MRFAGKGQETLTHLATMIFDRDVEDETFEAVSKFYGLGIDILKADQKLFLHYKDKLEKQDLTAAEMFKKLTETNLIQLLPEFSKALKIFAVLPVSSCEAERSFSLLRRLKTYLRNTMGQERLSSLTLMHIERATVNQVIQEDMKEMIDKFGRKGRDSHFF